MHPPVSVLVISFNRKEDLALSLEALYATNYPGLEVIVVDNASQDGAREVLSGFPTLKVILNKENEGFAEANNQGLALASGDYIALINNDAVVAPDYFDRLVGFMEAHPDCAAAGGKAYFWNENQPLGSRTNKYYSYSLVNPELGTSQAFTSTPDEVREVGTLSGCAVLIRRKAITDVGGAFLEPLFFTYYEETDFFARAIRRGWKLYYIGEPAVWHRVRASTVANPYHYLFHMQRNRILYGYRNFENPELTSLEAELNRTFRRKYQLRPLNYLFPKNVERRALRDALVWWRRKRDLLHQHREMVSGGTIGYNQALRKISAQSDYYFHSRPEVVALVPETAKRVVDIGCGAGGVGMALKARNPGIEVRGVELMPTQAERAKRVLDDARVGVGEDPMPSQWPQPDCLIFADVLEHMANPYDVLRRWTKNLALGGSVIISLPNVAHHSALRPLLEGHWRYQDAGVLDRTHLRFFTLDTAIELIEKSGLEIIRMERVIELPPRNHWEWRFIRYLVKGIGKEPHGGIRNGWRRFALDYSTVQFLFQAKRTEGA